MKERNKDIQHFILTRFNLFLWRKDKKGSPVRTTKWLSHRFSLFERYCLPSIKNQSCKDFEWIILFDTKTPERFKSKIAEYQKDFPQFIPVFVEPEDGRLFAQIFKREVVKRLRAKRVITSYLDNDDALNLRFVEDLQRRVLSLSDETFVFFTNGLQFYTDHKYLMQIHYPRNHFVSVVECGDPSVVKTIYGYGSHYYIDRIKGARIEYVDNLPMWCEVIHEKNMGNDAYFLGAKMIKDSERLRKEFAIDETIYFGANLYLFRFLPRYGKTFIRRSKHYLFGRHW